MNPLDPCKNCGLGIHPGFTTCPMCKTEDPFDKKTCSICLDTISQEDEKQLDCLHILHKICYESLIRNKSYKCPLCRQDFALDNTKCGLCNKDVKMDESLCETFRSLECGCLFHYECIQKERIVGKCKNCNKWNKFENIEALSYLYLQNAYEKWIGQMPKCCQEGCQNRGNPKRLGYCIRHNEYTTTNIAIIIAFKYFTKFIREPIYWKREHIFSKLVNFCDSKYKHRDIDHVNFQQMKTEFTRYFAENP